MLYLITQRHAPDHCPIHEGGAKILYHDKAEGVDVKAVYGDYPNHTIYYVVEAADLAAIQRFLDPGMRRCTATVSPIVAEPVA